VDTHLKRPDVRASWIFPLVEALLKDVDAWCRDEAVQKAFTKDDTFALVFSTIQSWWRQDDTTSGSVPLAPRKHPSPPGGLYAPQFLMATLLDPATCPASDDLPEDWEDESEKVMKQFYQGKEFLDAHNELMTLLDHQGKFGKEVARYKDAIQDVDPSTEAAEDYDTPPTHNKHGQCLHVQRVVDRQLPSTDTRPHLVWKLSLKTSFPLLLEIARRVLVMGTASANADWTGKLQQAVSHTFKGNNKDLKTNKHGRMMLYCHMNIRHLLSKIKGDSRITLTSTAACSNCGEQPEFGKFLEQGMPEDKTSGPSETEEFYECSSKIDRTSNGVYVM